MAAASNEARGLAALPLDQGADVNARDKSGRRPFSMTTGYSSRKAVLCELLRRHGEGE